jgi:capsid assembly protease
LQDSVNAYYDQFTKAVARGRSTDPQAVKDGFGQGRMVSAQKAVKAGMADRVATLDQTLARLGARTAMPKSVKAEVETVLPEAAAIAEEGTDPTIAVADVPVDVTPTASPELLVQIALLEQEIELDAL